MTRAETRDGNKKAKAHLVNDENIAVAARQRGAINTIERTTAADNAVPRTRIVRRGTKKKSS